MKIGEVEVPASVPDNLNERLLSTVGVSAVEVLRLLGGHCLPGLLARLIEPLAVEGETPPRGELTALIVKAGVGSVRAELAEIYRAACGVEAPASPPAPVEPDPLTVAEYCRRYMAGDGRDDPAMLQFAVNNGEAVEAEFARLNELAAAATAPPGRKRKGRR